MKYINKYKSPNFNERKKGSKIKFIILHYTAMRSDKKALDYLSYIKNKVSSHFLINKKGCIFNLVDLKMRAWHAGLSFWNDEIDINSYSLGIELDNSGHHINFEKYTKKQIYSLIKLLRYLKKKFNIRDENILGHSDISPYRKIDPGEKFPWLSLSKSNLINSIIKINEIAIKKINKKLTIKKLNNNNARSLYMLSKIGYHILPAKNNKKNFLSLIRVYQMRFRPELINGIIDNETYFLIASHYSQLNQ